MQMKETFESKNYPPEKPNIHYLCPNIGIEFADFEIFSNDLLTKMKEALDLTRFSSQYKKSSESSSLMRYFLQKTKRHFTAEPMVQKNRVRWTHVRQNSRFFRIYGFSVTQNQQATLGSKNHQLFCGD
jgi:hypothetical protein